MLLSTCRLIYDNVSTGKLLGGLIPSNVIFSLFCNNNLQFNISMASISDLEKQRLYLFTGVVALASVLVLVLLIITIVCIKKR